MNNLSCLLRRCRPCDCVEENWLCVLYQPNSVIHHHLAASTNPRFRDFLLHRNRLLLLKKWGAALESHEPYESSPAAVERALARAEVFADQCRRAGSTILRQSARREIFDAAEQNARAVQKKRALQKAYVRHQRTLFVRTILITKPPTAYNVSPVARHASRLGRIVKMGTLRINHNGSHAISRERFNELHKNLDFAAVRCERSSGDPKSISGGSSSLSRATASD